jgi:DNA-binding NarL/FixJ family response regulator
MPNPNSPVVICHIEDHYIIRFGVAEMLSDSPEYAYVHQFYDGKEFLDSWPIDPLPGIILLDLGLPNMDGQQVLQWLQQNEVKIPVIIMSAEPALHTLVKPYMKLNVQAFLNKDCKKEELLSALKDVLSDGVHFNIIMREGLLQTEGLKDSEPELVKKWKSLPERQKEFAVLATEYPEKSHKQLADIMKIEFNTAKSHAREIHAALGIHSRLELVLLIAELWHADALNGYAGLLSRKGWMGKKMS